MTRFAPTWLVLASVTSIAALAPLGCGKSGAGARCDSEELQTACGGSCERNSDCGPGLYCGTDLTCIADCIAGEKDELCDGRVCSAIGRCPGSDDDFGGDSDIDDDANGDSSDGAAGSAGCIDVNVDFSQQLPNVLLLIDRSGSMNAGGGFGTAVQAAVSAGEYELGNCPSNNTWRWNVVRDVLLNPERGVVPPLEDKVRFGLSLYTSLDGSLDGGQCPMMENVPIAIDNYDAMLDVFHCSDYLNNGDTPTGPALLAAADILEESDLPGPKVIVLATDGEPDDCECPDFSGSHVPDECDDRADGVKDDVVEIAGLIRERGIEVHVINVSTPDNASLQQHLAQVAEAGGGQAYPGFDPGELGSAFESIIEGARSCKIDLDGSIAEGKESSGTVLLDGEPLELGSPHGWRVNDPSQIELRGDACDAIKSGDHTLSIDFPCGSYTPPSTN